MIKTPAMPSWRDSTRSSPKSVLSWSVILWNYTANLLSICSFENISEINSLTAVPAWAGLDFARVRFWPQPPLERLFWSPFVLVVFGNVQPIRIHQLRIYLKAWGGPRREDFLSLSKKITFHSKWLPCSSRVNFQDGNISLSEGRITFWNLKIERRSSKEHSTS